MSQGCVPRKERGAELAPGRMEVPAIFTEAEFYQQNFDPQEYLKEFYSMSSSREGARAFMMQNLRILHKMFSSVSSSEAPRGVGWHRFQAAQHGASCGRHTHAPALLRTPLCLHVSPCALGIAAGAVPQFLGTPPSPAGAGEYGDSASAPGAGTVPATGSGPSAGVVPAQGYGQRALALWYGAVPRVCGTWGHISGLGGTQPQGHWDVSALEQFPSSPEQFSPHSAPDGLRGDTLIEVSCGPTTTSSCLLVALPGDHHLGLD